MKLAYRVVQQMLPDTLQPSTPHSHQPSRSPSSPTTAKTTRDLTPSHKSLEISQWVHRFCQSDWGLIDVWLTSSLSHLGRWFQKQRF